VRVRRQPCKTPNSMRHVPNMLSWQHTALQAARMPRRRARRPSAASELRCRLAAAARAGPGASRLGKHEATEGHGVLVADALDVDVHHHGLKRAPRELDHPGEGKVEHAELRGRQARPVSPRTGVELAAQHARGSAGPGVRARLSKLRCCFCRGVGCPANSRH